MIDFDASPVITQHRDYRDLGKELYQQVLEVASGAETKAETLEDFSWVTPPFGKI